MDKTGTLMDRIVDGHFASGNPGRLWCDKFECNGGVSSTIQFCSNSTHVSSGSWLSVKMNVQQQSSLLWAELSNILGWNVWYGTLYTRTKSYMVNDCETDFVTFAEEEWEHQAGFCSCSSPPPALDSLLQGIGLEECRWLLFRSTLFSFAMEWYFNLSLVTFNVKVLITGFVQKYGLPSSDLFRCASISWIG